MPDSKWGLAELPPMAEEDPGVVAPTGYSLNSPCKHKGTSNAWNDGNCIYDQD